MADGLDPEPASRLREESEIHNGDPYPEAAVRCRPNGTRGTVCSRDDIRPT